MYLFVCLSIYLISFDLIWSHLVPSDPIWSIYLATCWAINQSTNQPISLSIYQPINQPINQSTNQPANQPINQSINPSANQSIYPSICLSAWLSLSLSLSLSHSLQDANMLYIHIHTCMCTIVWLEPACVRWLSLSFLGLECLNADLDCPWSYLGFVPKHSSLNWNPFFSSWFPFSSDFVVGAWP